MSRVSVIVPSRLQINPTSEAGSLWLDRSLMTVRRQTVFAAHEWEFLVGLDANAPWPPERFTDVRFIRSVGAGQALAVNAAAAHATGDVLAFLEDDDYWYPGKIERHLDRHAADYEFVSSNSREIDEYANFLRVNDFPTGWTMTRETWAKVGPFDESFRWHVDTEWLGRANCKSVRRCHLVSAGRVIVMGEGGTRESPDGGNWLAQVYKHSDVIFTEEPEPLVGRLVNPHGGMSKIATDPEAAAQSREEHERMIAKFGEVPW
jgi:GT2 family glycosyltransferase